jgi:hypothetical protein
MSSLSASQRTLLAVVGSAAAFGLMSCSSSRSNHGGNSADAETDDAPPSLLEGGSGSGSDSTSEGGGGFSSGSNSGGSGRMTFSCTVFGGGLCTQLVMPSSAAALGTWDQDCTSEGGTSGMGCVAAGLVGCCQPLASDPSQTEQCYYDASLAMTGQQACSLQNRAWSAATDAGSDAAAPASVEGGEPTRGEGSDAAPSDLGDAATAEGSVGGDDAEGGACFPDNDGINGGSYTIDLTVDDTGFSAAILATQNDARVTLTLTNMGTTPHGFEVECTSVTPAYPTVPPGCPTTVCFPANSTIAPLAPGASMTTTFDTPTPDGLIYPFKSSEPSDSTVPGLNNGQWSLM